MPVLVAKCETCLAVEDHRTQNSNDTDPTCHLRLVFARNLNLKRHHSTYYQGTCGSISSRLVLDIQTYKLRDIPLFNNTSPLRRHLHLFIPFPTLHQKRHCGWLVASGHLSLPYQRHLSQLRPNSACTRPQTLPTYLCA